MQLYVKYCMRSFYALLLIGGLALSMCFMPLSAQAQTIAPARAAHVWASSQSIAAKGHVTILVLDMSGSMSTNDPNSLRCSAANAFIDLSGPGEFVGVVGLDNNTG